MENNTFLVRVSHYGWESGLLMTAGVAGDSYLAAGLLLGSVLLGLVSYVSAFWSQHKRLKEAINSQQHDRLRGAISSYRRIYAILITDVVNAISSILSAIQFIVSAPSPGVDYTVISSLWFLFRGYGLIYHLLIALMCLRVPSHPQQGANQNFVYMLVVQLMVFLFGPFYFFFSRVAIFGLGAITIGLALAIIAKCTLFPSVAAQKKPIVFVAMFTFLIVYAPSFILQCLMISRSTAHHGEPTDKYFTIYVKVLLGTNFQLLMNGLLCYFILKLHIEGGEQQQREQEQQQHQGFENSNYNYENSANATMQL